RLADRCHPNDARTEDANRPGTRGCVRAGIRAYWCGVGRCATLDDSGMKLETTRLATLDVDPTSVMTFTQPLLGFQEFRRYILLPGPSDHLTWLQSTDSPGLAFILMDPRAIMPEYDVDLRQQELSELAVPSADDLDVYTLIVV